MRAKDRLSARSLASEILGHHPSLDIAHTPAGGRPGHGLTSMPKCPNRSASFSSGLSWQPGWRSLCGGMRGASIARGEKSMQWTKPSQSMGYRECQSCVAGSSFSIAAHNQAAPASPPRYCTTLSAAYTGAGEVAEERPGLHPREPGTGRGTKTALPFCPSPWPVLSIRCPARPVQDGRRSNGRPRGTATSNRLRRLEGCDGELDVVLRRPRPAPSGAGRYKTSRLDGCAASSPSGLSAHDLTAHS